MTKRLLFLAVAAIFLSINFKANAQDERLDSISFASEPLREETNPYFGVGGGYVAGFQFVNTDEINKSFNNQFGVDEFKSPLYLQGVEGFTGIIVVPNMRVGFMGISGSQIKSKDTANLKRNVELSASMMGFTVNYGIVPFKSFAILPGINLGWGTYDIEHYQTSGDKSWSDIKNQNANNYYEKFERSFMFAQPNVTFEYALTNFLVFRVSASYNVTFKNFIKGDEFTYNKTAALKDAPSGVKPDGLAIQLGLFGGLFNY